MNKALYFLKLEALKKEDPQNILLPDLKRGFSRANSIYLEWTLGQLPPSEAPGQADDPPGQPQRDEKSYYGTDNQDLISLYKIQSRLYGKRAKASNKFHDLKTDKARALNSERIQAIQKEIEQIRIRIRALKETGTDPGQSPGPAINIPPQPLDQLKLLQSKRASISRYRKILGQLNEQEESRANFKKIQEIEDKIQKLIKTRDYVQKIIEKATSQHR